MLIIVIFIIEVFIGEVGEQKFGWKTFIPKFEFTTDNAAMIAIVGYLKYLEGDFAHHDIMASARLKI